MGGSADFAQFWAWVGSGQSTYTSKIRKNSEFEIPQRYLSRRQSIIDDGRMQRGR